MRFSTIVTILAVLGLSTPAAAQTWNEITPASGPMPTARWVPSAVFDTTERRMIIFGGESSGSVRRNDIWAFDLDANTWEDLTPASGPMPDPRRTPMSVYDPVGHQMITWSGQGAGGTFFSDVWSFDLTGNTWTGITPTGGPPAIRYGAAGVYDPATGDLVTFAGFTFQGRFEDVWRFNVAGDTWTDVSPPVVDSPLKRCLHSASYDSYNHRLIMYGGQNSGALHDIWAFDLATETWEDLTPVVFPPGRWFSAHVYDAANHRATIYGGNTNGSKAGDVLLFDLWTNEWTPMAPSGTPPTDRDGPTAIYDGDNDRMVVFGGHDGAHQNDVWELTDLSDTPTAARNAPASPVKLTQNFPNPFNPSTTIAFELTAPAPVSLRVYDARGRLVRTLVDGARAAGPHRVTWDGRDDRGVRAASGVYFYRLSGPGIDRSRKMSLIQ